MLARQAFSLAFQIYYLKKLLEMKRKMDMKKVWCKKRYKASIFCNVGFLQMISVTVILKCDFELFPRSLYLR